MIGAPLRTGHDFRYAGAKHAAPKAREKTREMDVVFKEHGWDGEQDKLNPWRFLLLLVGVGLVAGFILWAHGAGYIKHVENVPPPVTAPTDMSGEAGPAAPPH